MSLRHLSLSLVALACIGQPLTGADDAQPTPEYLAEKAQLEEMLTKRDLELFELQYLPGKLGRVAIVDRRGVSHVFNYLTFSIRNQASIDPAQMATRAKGYNEVLQAIAQQYEMAKVDSEGGVKLKIDGVEGQDGIVLERTEAKLKTRTASISAMAYDENGSRIRLLDEPPGSGPQEGYQFPDLGETTYEGAVAMVRERAEEAEGRRLLSPDELRRFPLPPFDGVTRIDAPNIEDPAHDTHGWLVGEAHGVLLFPRLSDHGDRFTVQINGLCNKLRFRNPVAEPGKPENYFQARVMRRTMVLSFVRPGDEFFRDLDKFDMVGHGYRWVDSFQRTDVKRMISYSRYLLGNIADEKGAINTPVHDQFWPYYDELRAANAKLPDLKPGAAPQ